MWWAPAATFGIGLVLLVLGGYLYGLGDPSGEKLAVVGAVLFFGGIAAMILASFLWA